MERRADTYRITSQIITVDILKHRENGNNNMKWSHTTKTSKKTHRHKHTIKHQGTLKWQAKQQSKPFLIWSDDESNKHSLPHVTSKPLHSNLTNHYLWDCSKGTATSPEKPTFKNFIGLKISTLNKRIWVNFDHLNPSIVGRHPKFWPFTWPPNWAGKIAFILVSWLSMRTKSGYIWIVNYDA